MFYRYHEEQDVRLKGEVGVYVCISSMSILRKYICTVSCVLVAELLVVNVVEDPL